MTAEEIKHLGTLSRLSLTEAEVATFSQEIDAILAYVGTVSAIAGDGALPKVVGKVHNPLRKDVVTNTPGAQTEVLLAAAPKRTGQYVEVMKIIDQGE
jgi:aspartyl-tRNA(Asn)/glutamyl-tRNA(Gln) amidotransferase subunit C